MDCGTVISSSAFSRRHLIEPSLRAVHLWAQVLSG
jgi:hypothetical protein